MKKIIFTTALAITGFLFNSNAQNPNLVFDNTFNNGNPSDDFPQIGGNSFITTYGSMEAINDSMFVYFINELDNPHTVYGRVLGKTIHGNGAVNHYTIHEYTTTFDSGVSSSSDYEITDIAVAPNGELFVVQNAMHLDGPLLKKGILVTKYNSWVSGNGWDPSTSWGTSGSYYVEHPSEVYNGKGVAFVSNGSNIVVYSRYGSNQIAQLSITDNGSGTSHSLTVLTSNNATTHSVVADVLYVSPTEIYIADNAYTRVLNSTQGYYEYNDLARVLKVTSGTLSTSYGVASSGISQPMNWNTDNNTLFAQDIITKLVYHGGQVMIVGYSQPFYVTTGSYPPQGRYTRLGTDGNIAPSSPSEGKIFPDFLAPYTNYEFYDIDHTLFGFHMLSGGGYNGTNSQCFLLAIDEMDASIETAYGNNGFMFESSDYSYVQQAHYIHNGTGDMSQHSVVFNGVKHPDGFNSAVPAFGRLVWNTAAGIDNIQTQNGLNLYPNPANNVLNIELKDISTPLNVQIVNLLGETVISTALNHQISTLNVSNMPSGVYFVQTENGASTKFIKQ